MRVLITGYSGFAGSHLTDHLLAVTDWRIWGTVFGRRASEGCCSDKVVEIPADLRDPHVVRAVVEEARPDIVFHLAGESSVAASWDDPWGTFEANVRMQYNLHEALNALGAPHRMVVVASNEVYGAVPEESQPVGEDQPFAPQNPYAASKAMQDLVAGMYGRLGRGDVIRLRPFTHIGPRQDPRFVTPSLARQVAAIEAGLAEPVVRVGNLAAERDISDVRDIVRAYRVAGESGRPGEAYNLGCERARPIRAILDALLAISTVHIEVEPDPARMRPADVPRSLCDATKAHRELGWYATVPFEQTVADVLEEWRDRVRSEREDQA